MNFFNHKSIFKKILFTYFLSTPIRFKTNCIYDIHTKERERGAKVIIFKRSIYEETLFTYPA